MSRRKRESESKSEVTEWRIVIVDHAPLRNETIESCRRVMKELEAARTTWRHFEKEDKPAFARWMATTFGPVLTQIRENSARLREHERLIQEVEREMYLRGWPTHEAAYCAIMRRREEAANPPKPPQPTGPDGTDEPEARDWEEISDDDEEEPEELNEFEQELLFEQFVSSMGMNVNRLSDQAYEKLLTEFRKKLAEAQGKCARETDEAREGADAEPEERVPTPEKKPENLRVKDLYRLLVRRLHPDSRGDLDAQTAILWHEVQEAYAASNLERLEMLLAFTDIHLESTGEHTSLFQMRSVLAELTRSVQALKRSLAAARKELAWDFARGQNRENVEKRLRTQFARDIATQEEQLREAGAFIASWTNPRHSRPRRSRGAEDEEYAF